MASAVRAVLLKSCVIVSLLPASFAACAQTVFSYASEPGDYIGQGQSATYTPANATFDLFASGNGGVAVSVQANDGRDWFIDLAVPQGVAIGPGRYADAERTAFKTGRSPGVDVSGNGRGCNATWGEVDVRQASFSRSGALETFEASFVQRCDGAQAPAFTGVIRYKATPLSLALKSDQGDYVGGGVKKSYYNDSSIFALAGTTASFQYAASGLRDDWSASVSAPTGRQLAVGVYQIARMPDAAHAGFDFNGNGRGCNMSAGTLDVKRITTDASGNVLGFYADFEQHCEGAAAALRGTIRYKL